MHSKNQADNPSYVMGLDVSTVGTGMFIMRIDVCQVVHCETKGFGRPWERCKQFYDWINGVYQDHPLIHGALDVIAVERPIMRAGGRGGGFKTILPLIKLHGVVELFAMERFEENSNVKKVEYHVATIKKMGAHNGHASSEVVRDKMSELFNMQMDTDNSVAAAICMLAGKEYGGDTFKQFIAEWEEVKQ